MPRGNSQRPAGENSCMDIDGDTAATSVPQTEPMSDKQVRNSAGGCVFQVTDLQQLKRFLCIGCESGTYYVTEKELLVTNVTSLKNLVDAGKGVEAVATIRQMSVEGRTAKQDGVLSALALCAHSNDPATRAAAFACLPEVCRTPTHLFQFVDFGQRVCAPRTGWGRAQRRAVAAWYLRFADSPKRLAYLATKYRNRGGWSHRDLLRLCHAKTDNQRLNCVLRYCVKGLEAARDAWPTGDHATADGDEVLAFLEAVERLRGLGEGAEADCVGLIETFRLVREHVPAPLLGSNMVRMRADMF